MQTVSSVILKLNSFGTFSKGFRLIGRREEGAGLLGLTARHRAVGEQRDPINVRVDMARPELNEQ